MVQCIIEFSFTLNLVILGIVLHRYEVGVLVNTYFRYNIKNTEKLPYQLT